MRNGVNVFCWMSFCAALMGGCKEAPAEIPVVGVEDVLVDNIEIYGDYVGLIKGGQPCRDQCPGRRVSRKNDVRRGQTGPHERTPLLYQ